MRISKFLLLVIVLSLASCKSPLLPQSSPKITFLNPKDTTIADSLRVVFRYRIDNAPPNRDIVQWNFSDGSSDTSSVSLNLLTHTFPALGSYSFSVLLLDTVSKTKVDSGFGIVRIVESPLALAELQQMKYFKVQIYARVHHSFSTYSTDGYDTDAYTVNIDPSINQLEGAESFGPDVIKNTQITWNGNTFTLLKDSLISYQYFSEINNWNVIGIFNNNKIDSFNLKHEYHEVEYHSTWTDYVDVYKNSTITSLPFAYRSVDSLVFQEKKLINLESLKDIYYSNHANTNTKAFKGPFWNSVPTEYFVRIILYK